MSQYYIVVLGLENQNPKKMYQNCEANEQFRVHPLAVVIDY